MATGPFNVYNKASEFQTRCGQLVNADFTTGAALAVNVGLSTVHAVVVSLNADPVAATGIVISADINTDGTIDVRQWEVDGTVSSTPVDCSWIAIGVE